MLSVLSLASHFYLLVYHFFARPGEKMIHNKEEKYHAAAG
jgi:hypothetical protein